MTEGETQTRQAEAISARPANIARRCKHDRYLTNFNAGWRNDALSYLQETGRRDAGESLPAVLFGALPDGRSWHLGG
jgi:hypothetical protein